MGGSGKAMRAAMSISLPRLVSVRVPTEWPELTLLLGPYSSGSVVNSRG